jgi:tetratricopeptide (TPR) repeat protein
LALAALAAVIFPVVSRFYQADRTDYPYVRDLGANYLRPVGYRDYLFLGEENSSATTGIEALTTLEYARPDIFYVDITGNANYFDVFDFGGEDMTHASPEEIGAYYYEIMAAVVSDPRYDYYFLYPHEYIEAWRYGMVRDGTAYRLVRERRGVPRADVVARFEVRGVDPPREYWDHWTRGTVGTFLYELHQFYEPRDKARAEEYFAASERVGRRSHSVQHNLGTVFYLRREHERAVPYLERAVVLDPTSFFTRYLLADCYERLGRREESRHELEEALRYRPGYTPALVALDTGSFVTW